jgi:UDP-N-acetylglucosamine 3-dehydrogenase
MSLTATRTFKVMLFGGGNMGRNHLRALLAHPGFEVVGLVDPRLPSPEELGVSQPSWSRCRDIEEAFRVPFDCAIVATPTTTHFEVASALIRERRAVLVEKPVAHSSSAGKELLDLAKFHETLVLVGHIERANPVVRKLKNVIDGGWLGIPIHVNITRIGGSPKHVDSVDSVLMDLAVHDVDVLRFLFGNLSFVNAVCHCNIQEGVYDTAEMMLICGGNVSASIHVNWITPTKVRNLRITGSKGVCFVDYMLQTCTLFGGSLVHESTDAVDGWDSLLERYQNSDQIAFGVQKVEPLVKQLEEFYSALLGRSHHLCSLEEGIDAVAIVEQALEGARRFSSLSGDHTHRRGRR